GGSGTRVVAEVLIRSGVFMGDDLNESNDNLLFTRLFKDPQWYREASSAERENRLALFESYMQNGKLTPGQLKVLYASAENNPTLATSFGYYLKMSGAIWRKKKMRDVWGWKEPNTHIYLPEILNFFPNIRYIHVIRHGLDMAFSGNK